MSGHTYTHTYTHTYIHTHRTTTVTLAAHARRGLIIIIIHVINTNNNIIQYNTINYNITFII